MNPNKIKLNAGGMPEEIKEGDYVLATKFSDGDAADPWAIGFDTGRSGDRHFVKDSDGKQIRISGFRCVKKISDNLGNWLYTNRAELERMASQTTPDIFNLWMIADNQADLVEKVKGGCHHVWEHLHGYDKNNEYRCHKCGERK